MWSDHAAITLHVTTEPEVRVVEGSGNRNLPPAPPPSVLDTMVAEALASARTKEEEAVVYYGPILAMTPPTSVYLASSYNPKHKQAASAIYWGENSRMNKSSLVPGSQSDARAALYAVTLAILTAPQDRALSITTVSENAIRAFCYWAGANATRGWPGQNSDILRVTAELLRARP
ncbi:hypothetical protein B0H13DRAFT_1600624, partial [Mycena leptocephala]